MFHQGALCFLALLLMECAADTPANCTFTEISGKWTLYEGYRNKNSSEDCSSMSAVVRKLKVDLQYPNIAVDEFGNLGHWTMVYNEGFEVTVNERTFFAFLYYIQDTENVTSFCGRTFPGLSHDVTLRHWACFYGRKQAWVAPKTHRNPFTTDLKSSIEVPSYEAHQALVERINSHQTAWKAEIHRPFLHKSHSKLLNIRGGKRSWLAHRPNPAPSTPLLKANVASLPINFDWRNRSGVNFVSPVRNQGECGSCYAFSSMGMLEARLRVKTNNTMKVELSPQDIVSCSDLSQGCSGGFPFLVAGKYGKDFGVVAETCNPYQGHDGPCTRETCSRHYTASYGYIGGYYGACNEHHMQVSLVRGGPLSVSFEVQPDFLHYKGGVYHHTGLLEFNPFVLVNHAVLLVGYGVEKESGEKYWIVKNSWGDTWGENGFFRIRRGTNEVGIESIAVHVTPIP